MNGLRASSGTRSIPLLKATATLALSNKVGIVPCQDCIYVSDACAKNNPDPDCLDEETISLDELQTPLNSDVNDLKSNDENCKCISRESNSLQSQEEVIASFLDRFLRTTNHQQQQLLPLQPINVLQEKYAALQYLENKQAQVQSVKRWYSDQRRILEIGTERKKNEIWWTSTLEVPWNIARQWGFQTNNSISNENSQKCNHDNLGKLTMNVQSGNFPLDAAIDWESVLSRLAATAVTTVDNDKDCGTAKKSDILLDLFGVYKIVSNHNSDYGKDMNNEDKIQAITPKSAAPEIIYFKTKNGARKSASINLLLLMHLMKIYRNEKDPNENTCGRRCTAQEGRDDTVLSKINLSSSTEKTSRQVLLNNKSLITNSKFYHDTNVSCIKQHESSFWHEKQFPWWVEKMHNLGFRWNCSEGGVCTNLPRLKLLSIKYRAAMMNSYGTMLSKDNPCGISCTVSYNDLSKGRLSEYRNEISSKKSHSSKDASLDDVVHQLEVMNAKSATSKNEPTSNNHADQVFEKQQIMDCNLQPIEYEVVLPRWATSTIESQVFLYELIFRVAKSKRENEKTEISTNIDNKNDFDHDTYPLSHALGLDENASTRIGVVLGCDLFDEDTHVKEKDLCASFQLPRGNVFTEDDSTCVSVTMRKILHMNTSDMLQQLKQACIKDENVQTGKVDPLKLMKFFNVILFENGGRTYGIGARNDWSEILDKFDTIESSGNDRTYLFLPLVSSSKTSPSSISNNINEVIIDWKTIIDTVNHVPRPIMWRFNINPKWFTLFKSILAGFLMLELLLCIPISMDSSSFLTKIRNVCSLDVCLSFQRLIESITFIRRNIAIFVLSIYFLSKVFDSTIAPNKMPTSILSNRFLTQPIGFKKWIFVLNTANNDVAQNSFSLLLPHLIVSNLSDKLKDIFYERNKFPLTEATYAKYYQRLKKAPLQYPEEKLIKVSRVSRHIDHDFTTHMGICNDSQQCTENIHFNSILSDGGYLVPELVFILPMPRDLLYLCQHASNFMSALERNYSLQFVALRLQSIKSQACQLLHYKDNKVSIDNLLNLIDQATFMAHCQNTSMSSIRNDERLESLGDSVLLFFIVLNLFAENPSDKHQCTLDVFDTAIKIQGKNTLLSRAGLLLGLHRLHFLSSASWQSIYEIHKMSPSPTGSSYIKRLGNMFESLLGATYLFDSTGCMTVGLLNEMSSCFTESIVDSKQISGPYWFNAKGTCLNGAGYPFNNDVDWTHELTRIQKALCCKNSVLAILQSDAKDLYDFLLHHSKRQDLIATLDSHPFHSLLLHSALFDDSLDESLENPETVGLECLAKLRDKIFHVGNASLQLKIVEEIYHHYPNATSGDVHFMKVVAFSDDSITYIMVKNRFHQYLFDKNAESTSHFLRYMIEAESLGEELWKKNGGWVLPGGTSEYHRRVLRMNKGEGNSSMQGPQYAGLAAGRLLGQKSKVPIDITEELVFSMKCIVGALCLSLGLENAWSLMRPFFLELFLLSPDEMRVTYSGLSPLVDLYRKGRK